MCSLLDVVSSVCAFALEQGIDTEYVGNLFRMYGIAVPLFDTSNAQLRIRTLGEFSVMRANAPLTFSHKSPKKPLALLKVLIALQGENVSEARLADWLWPYAAGDAAHKALSVSLFRLRNLIDNRNAIRLRDGRVSLDTHFCWVDARAFELTLDQADSMKDLVPREPWVGLIQRALDFYCGAFLPEDVDEPWSISTRERLRSKMIRHVAELASHYAQESRWDDALQCYRKGLEVDDLAEEFSQGLMRCCFQLDRRAEGMCAYRRLRQTLSIVLGVPPSRASEALFNQLRG